jgi:hypothetical protein
VPNTTETTQNQPNEKAAMYKTARLTRDLPGIEAGEFVSIVRYHEYNGTYSIRSASGCLQAMVGTSILTDFCL